jgi:hypothetical protein
MYRKILFGTILLAGLVYFCVCQTLSVRAQDVSPSEESSCRICHEKQYYLYDTGKWYCLCGEQRTCTDCHGGFDDVWEVDAAHAGMLANPLVQDPEICQSCHPDDAQHYIDKFAAVAGIDLQATPEPTQTPYVPVINSAAEEPLMPALEIQPDNTWRKLALGLLGLGFLGVIIFGYQCWQADCQNSRRAI